MSQLAYVRRRVRACTCVYSRNAAVRGGFRHNDGMNAAPHACGLTVGTHNLTLVVFDISGNTAIDTVFVRVAAPVTTTFPTTSDTTTSGTTIDNMTFSSNNTGENDLSLMALILSVSSSIVIIVVMVLVLRRGFK